ncbi:hypothetical protein PRIPAC_94843 [Pristionchus pacificus]|uniref:Uncharacterized protein n=1 Tax=Pristionchus pacificus TaxID=54126 RepID=A0A2A6BPD5_PRIPA|nr:hypothetical protein PRIPAC_94843 [Pristionchus pacificus]|eukprot:PDM67770.1 hypothetical protein PRIPAC_45814 [Pristionchus pacificus]
MILYLIIAIRNLLRFFFLECLFLLFNLGWSRYLRIRSILGGGVILLVIFLLLALSLALLLLFLGLLLLLRALLLILKYRGYVRAALVYCPVCTKKCILSKKTWLSAHFMLSIKPRSSEKTIESGMKWSINKISLGNGQGVACSSSALAVDEAGGPFLREEGIELIHGLAFVKKLCFSPGKFQMPRFKKSCPVHRVQHLVGGLGRSSLLLVTSDQHGRSERTTTMIHLEPLHCHPSQNRAQESYAK